MSIEDWKIVMFNPLSQTMLLLRWLNHQTQLSQAEGVAGASITITKQRRSK